jgi:hypothetical protein
MHASTILWVGFLLGSPAFAGNAITDHLRGSWRGTSDRWHFQDTEPRISMTTSQKFLDAHGSAFYCLVEWQGHFNLRVCTDASRAKGFCYNKGRVAKYIMGAGWDTVNLVADPANTASCSAYVSQLNSDKSKPHIFLGALALAGDNEIWINQTYLQREVP